MNIMFLLKIWSAIPSIPFKDNINTNAGSQWPTMTIVFYSETDFFFVCFDTDWPVPWYLNSPFSMSVIRSTCCEWGYGTCLLHLIYKLPNCRNQKIVPKHYAIDGILLYWIQKVINVITDVKMQVSEPCSNISMLTFQMGNVARLQFWFHHGKMILLNLPHASPHWHILVSSKKKV